jgi:putative inorganic carbon (HCO3(-)) transporter
LENFSRRLENAAAILTALGIVAVLFSIAASQILIALALLLLLASRRPLEFPSRLRYPLIAFIAWTLLSLAFSDSPLTGFSAVRKIFLFIIPLLVYNAYQTRRQIERTFQGVVLAGTIASLYGLGQFLFDYLGLRRAGSPIYENYVAKQITGFMSHWMTYGGELMLVLALLVSLLLYFRPTGLGIGWWLCLPPIGLALLASFTRGVWLGTLAGLTYLLACSRRRLYWLLLPAGVLLVYLLAPPWLQQRERSIFNAQTDPHNLLRLLMVRTGARMIAAHPLFGVGPERVGPEFLRYKPASIPLPPGSWYGHLHNDFLQIAAERGIPCLLFFLWLLFEILREGLTLARSPTPGPRAMGHAEVAVTVSLMVGGLFEYNFGDSEVLMLYLSIIAAAYTWTRLEKSGEPEPRPSGAQ